MSEGGGVGGFRGGVGRGGGVATMGNDKTIVKVQASWFDYVNLMSAVKVDAEVSSVALLPHDGGQGLARYIVIGDKSGKLYFFSPQGDLVLEHFTEIHSPGTQSHSLQRFPVELARIA
jgi:hypothetical protein